MEITTRSLLGTWRLASWTMNYSDGRAATTPYGESPSGLLTYSSDGFVQVSIASQGREPLGTDNVRRAPIERQIAAYQTYFTYAGPYEIDGDTVIHHILLSAQPELVGTEQHRHAELGNGRLVLSADYRPSSSQTLRQHRLVWFRGN